MNKGGNMQEKSEMRQIAKMMAKAISADEEFGENTGIILGELRRLKPECRLALKEAYIWSRKAPAEEREDLFQELFARLWEGKVAEEKLAYTIARCDWRDWWRKYKVRQHYSLDEPMDDTEGAKTLSEILVGEADFEAKMCLHLDCQAILNAMPKYAREAITKRLYGKPIRPNERRLLDQWAKANMSLLVD